jgi:hypothetical protein
LLCAGWPGTLYVAQAGFKLTILSLSLPMLALQVCVTTSSLLLSFRLDKVKPKEQLISISLFLGRGEGCGIHRYWEKRQKLTGFYAFPFPVIKVLINFADLLSFLTT